MLKKPGVFAFCMLDNEAVKKIEGFVSEKPRSVNEIASLLKKSWRTADRYVEEISREYGTISTRTFREGTRGALKVVYWSSVEKVSHSVFQQRLEQDIWLAREKKQFSAFDIFQHVPDKSKSASIERAVDEQSTNISELASILGKTEKQLLVFSGNLSFINLRDKKVDIFKVLEGLVKKNVSIKVVSRVDIVGVENIEKLLSLNFKYGKEVVEVRHREQPLRALVFDNKIFRMKEVKEPTGKVHELDKNIFIFYSVRDREWSGWLSRVFWKMFSSSISAEKRLEEIKKLV